MSYIRFKSNAGKIFYGSYISKNTAQIYERTPENKFIKTSQVENIYQLLAPVEPPNIFAIGFNYRDHIKETEAVPTKYPTIFMKPTTSLTAHEEQVFLPKCCNHGPEVDYEGELAVIIGRAGKNISKEDALCHVAGYTCANDISARKWQKHAGSGQWIRGKSFDSFCPLGPFFTPAKKVSDPQNLEIKTWLNNELVQHSNTKNMIFSIAQIIEYLSQETTLQKDTIILTGTPDGVGFSKKPPVFLKHNDEVKIEIEQIGTLINKVQNQP